MSKTKRFSVGEIPQHSFKILVVGESGAGKTSIITRYVENKFVVNLKSTLGLDFKIKPIQWEENIQIMLQFWDISGQERFGQLTKSYYKDAVAAIVVFDCTSNESFQKSLFWKDDLSSKVWRGGKQIPTLLFANKCDIGVGNFMEDRSVLNNYCKEKGFEGWFETSAKDNMGIDFAMKRLVELVMEEGPIDGKSEDPRIVRLVHSDSDFTRQGGGCC